MHRAKNTEHQLSLRGKITPKDMGSRVEKLSPFVTRPKRQRRLDSALNTLYSHVQSRLEDTSPQVLESACSFLISVIKNDSLADVAKRVEAESILGPLQGDEFGKIVALIGDISEYEGKDMDHNDEENSQSEEEEETAEEDSDMQIEECDEDSDSPDEKVSDPEWCTNTHYLKNILSPTSVKPELVLDLLCKDDPEEGLVKLFNFEFLDIVEVLLKNRLQIYWYTKYRNAETGLEREDALKCIQELRLEPTQGVANIESIDLESLIPSTNSRFAASSNLDLPEGSEKSVCGSYEQYTIPFQQHTGDEDPLVPISTMPKWVQPVFSEVEYLNRVQSKVYGAAFESSGSLLLCAPTGAGKTNVALLAMLQCLHAHKDNKVVYISPLKALVQEQVRTFSQRLQPLGITVGELSGDSNMTSDEIAVTRVIVTTPEKWDIITRKTFDVAYTSLVRLVIIDEIHLLHDPRGPALENIVSRYSMLDSDTRLIGLSATLPNYQDVASFLNAEHCFHFDSSFRPCPLRQTFCGITEKSVLKQTKALNETCLEKVMQFIDDYQTIVFVHSRKDTKRTANYFLDNSDIFPHSGVYSTDDSELGTLLKRGIGIHHAGLSRGDRSLVEQLFASRKLRVLISTATLAWGVNLPAHAVIVKGTQVYNPQEGGWQELSPQDTLQMLGRAGRPGFDTFGEGIVITLHDKLAYYMSVLTSQFPIESQLINRVTDSLNAEVCLGTIKNLTNAITWLGKTYYFARLRSAPVQYRAGVDYDDDGEFWHRRKVIVHSALRWLHKAKIVKYDGERVFPTQFGKISANFYISPSSMALYMKQLKPYMGAVDVFRVFSRSKEFESIPMRKEEYLEVQRLSSMVPIPVKDSLDAAAAKINILLQAFIGRLKLVGMALSADMVYITQSASRLFRAMFELALAQKWPALSLQLHQLYLMVDKQMWLTSSPLRQFGHCPPEVLHRTENSPMPWSHYLDAQSPQEIAKVIRSEKYSFDVYSMIQKFPKLEVSILQQPITPTMLRLNIEIVTKFRWDRSLHHNSQKFLLLVYDGDADTVFHSEWFLVTEWDDNITLQVTVPIGEPMTPVYYVTCVSDSWLHSEFVSPVNLEDLIIPEKFASPTQVRSLKPINLSHIDFSFTRKGSLDLMESQAFSLLYETDANTFIGMRGSRLNLIELVFARHFVEPGIIIYVHPDQDFLSNFYDKWHKLKCLENKIALLTGNITEDMRLLSSNKIIISSVKNMDRLTRKWQNHEAIQAINVAIFDESHLLGSHDGYIMERTIVRLKFMATQLERPIRFIAFSYPVAGDDLGKWFGASKSNILNYSPENRISLPSPKLEIKTFDQRDFNSRQKMMFGEVGEIQPDLVFVHSRDECVALANHMPPSDDSFTIDAYDKTLEGHARLGYPYIYHGMHPEDLRKVLELDSRTLIATADMAHRAKAVSTVLICNTQYQDIIQNGRFTDYTAVDVITMVENALTNAYIFTTPGKTAYYDRFLREPLPVESHLMYHLSDTVMVELAEQVVDTPEAILDWLTYSYFFQKLHINPSYYGLQEVSEEAISEYLSELLEATIEELSSENVIEAAETEDDGLLLTPMDGAFVGSVYGLSFTSITSLNKLQPSSTLRDIFIIVCSAEYDITMDQKQYSQILRLGKGLPFTTEASPVSKKVQVLLQLHLSRSLPPEWESDLKAIILQAMAYVKASIDILCGSGSLNALVALDLHQMLTQGLWDRDSPLKQIPFMDSGSIERCKEHEIEGVSDFLGIDDDKVRDHVLGFDQEDPRMVDVANFCNNFPAIDLEPVPDTVGTTVHIPVTRDIEEGEISNLKVYARYPYLSAPEQWYILVGCTETRELYAARKVSIESPEQVYELPLTLETPGTHILSVWCVCSGYLDADKESRVKVLLD